MRLFILQRTPILIWNVCLFFLSIDSDLILDGFHPLTASFNILHVEKSMYALITKGIPVGWFHLAVTALAQIRKVLDRAKNQSCSHCIEHGFGKTFGNQ
jgi:hypothetical protein